MLLQAAESWVLPLAFVCCCVGEGVRQRGSSMCPTGAVKAESVYRLAHSPEAQSVLLDGTVSTYWVMTSSSIN